MDENTNPSIDFKIFLNQQVNHYHKCSIQSCKSVERIITALMYYQALNNTKIANNNGNSIFSQFLQETYKCYLNDINHLIIIHAKDLELINKLLLHKSHSIACNVGIINCLLSVRHCQINDGKNANTLNPTNYTDKQFEQLMDTYNKTYSNSGGANSYAITPPPIINDKIFSNNTYNEIINDCNIINKPTCTTTIDTPIANTNNYASSPIQSDTQTTTTSTNPLFNTNNNPLKHENYISSLYHIKADTYNQSLDHVPTLSLCDNSFGSPTSLTSSNTSSNTSNTSNISNISNTSKFTSITAKSVVNNNNNINSKNKKSNRGRKKIDRSEFLNEQGRYQCRLCPKSYKRYNDLKGHYSIHSENTKRCPHCKKKFTRPIYLRDHIRTHTGEKPFTCDICGRKFAAKRNLVQHRKKHFRSNSRLCLDQEKQTFKPY